MLQTFYPLASISVTSKDPYFVNPKIKHLLRTKNRLMTKGRLAEVEIITNKICNRITAVNSVSYNSDFQGNTKDLWSPVRNITVKANQTVLTPLPPSITAQS